MEEKPYIVDGERLTKDEYNKKKFDRFLVTVYKGEKEKIRARAESLGMSLNAYIVALIEQDMENPRLKSTGKQV